MKCKARHSSFAARVLCLSGRWQEGVKIDQLGSYSIEAEYGRGGMSVVYSAVHDSLRTRHAIKVFDVSGCVNAEMLRGKFLAEARLLATLRHPNIVRVTDYGTTQDGRPWLAMDFIEGDTLATRLAKSIPPTRDEAASIYCDIRNALAYCHSHGIVHGDLKAENILLRDDGHAVLSDFGIARILNPEMRRRLELTRSCEAGGFGTAYALAPECRDGAPAMPCSDVYSFGVVMFKVVTGIWYEGSPRLIEQLATFAPDWKDVLSCMLESNPQKRLGSAGQLPIGPINNQSVRGRARMVALATCILLGILVCGVVVGMGFAPTCQIVSSGEEVILAPGSASMCGTAHIGRLMLPSGDGVSEIVIPKDFVGVLISAEEVFGDMRGQIRIVPQPGMRVIYRGNKEVVIKRQ